MNSFLALLKVQFLSLFGLNKIIHKKGKNVGILGFLGVGVLLCALIFGAGYVYIQMFLQSSIALGQVEGILPALFALSALVCFFLSFASTGLGLYSYKDYELLTTMPIKTNVIVLSKLAFTYLADLIFGVLILASGVFAYSEILPINTIQIVRLGVMSLFMPIFPMVVSIIIGLVFALISSRFRKKNLVQTILLILFMLSMFAVGFLSGSGAMEQINILGLIKKIYPLAPLVDRGMTSVWYVLLFILVSLVAFALIIWFVCATYKKMYTVLKTTKRSSRFTLGKYQQQSQFKVLLKKEIKTLFSFPVYAMNTLMGTFMSLLATVGLMIITVQLTGDMQGMEGAEQVDPSQVAQMFLMILHIAFAFSFMISPTTGVSISVEGNTFYLMKTFPIATKRIIKVKLMLNVIFAVIPAFIYATAYAFVMKGSSFILIIESILCATLYPLLAGNIGMIFNLLFPYLKWENITKAVKQSTATFFTVIIGMVFAGLVFVSIFFIKWQIEWIFALILAVLLLATVLTYLVIDKKGEQWIRQKT